MTAAWEVYAPVRIVFGNGKLKELSTVCDGRRIVLVTTPGFTKRGLTERVAAILGGRVAAVMDRVVPNPNIDDLDGEAVALRTATPDCIVALGGGSVMDTAKALSVLLAAPSTWRLSDHFHTGVAIPPIQPVPVTAVPTTAGTGAEVTPFATVWDHKAAKKYSLARADLFPETAVLDPELTLDLPEEVTVSTGLDAVSQAIESIWSRRSNAVTEAWALQSLRLSLMSLPALVLAPHDVVHRTNMLQASLLAGLAISQTRTAIAHSMSYPITAHFGLPHGLACSFTLPAILKFNAMADDGRLSRMAIALGFKDVQAMQDALIHLLVIVKARELFTNYVGEYSELYLLIKEMITPGRVDNNMRTVDLDDVKWILSTTKDFLFRAHP
jgi:phosphonate metabolism-associated iron-containing alcohol dehydrogenase